MPKALSLVVVVLSLTASTLAAEEPIIGGSCEGCENVFVGLPEELQWRSRITTVDEPGEPMVLEGTVLNLGGQPVEGIVIYAYQTDASGVYPKGTTRHGSLRAWVRTGEKGEYRFDTIRPGSYPGRSIPQHVHMHVIEPGKGTYYIDDVMFDDDPLLTQERRRQYVHGRGGNGVCNPEKDAEGVWHVRRDIILGKDIPGYPSERR